MKAESAILCYAISLPASYILGDIYWPDFSPAELERAIEWYNNRSAGFGKISRTNLEI